MMRGRPSFGICTMVLIVTPAWTADGTPALEGYCPVSLITTGILVEGNTEFSSTYDSRIYLFPSAEKKKMFDANQTAYVPALGGNCVVCKVEEGRIVPGKAAFHVVHDARLYLFPSAREQKMFQAEPEKYADADLALGGNCPVSMRSHDRVLPGKPDIVSIYDAHRYFFPSTGEKAVFGASPAAFSPVLWGNCVVCKVEEHKDVPGIPDYHLWHGHRMYVFSSAEHKRLFMSDPSKYSSADIALNGHCPVFKAERGMDMKGKDKFTVDYLGRRYWFSSWRRREQFLADTDKYALKE